MKVAHTPVDLERRLARRGWNVAVTPAGGPFFWGGRSRDAAAWFNRGVQVRLECATENALCDPDEIARFYDRCSDLMRELLDGLAASPDRPRPFPEIEDSIGWPRRRIASVLGGVSHLRHTEFAGRRPYRFQDTRQSESGRWEMWMDSEQARAVRRAQHV